MSMSIAEARGQLALACPAAGRTVLACLHLTGPWGPISGNAPREGIVEVLFDETATLSVTARFRQFHQERQVASPADVAGCVDLLLAELGSYHADARVDAGSTADFAAFSESALIERIGHHASARAVAEKMHRTRLEAVSHGRGDQLLADVL